VGRLVRVEQVRERGNRLYHVIWEEKPRKKKIEEKYFGRDTTLMLSVDGVNQYKILNLSWINHPSVLSSVSAPK
jgi:hypothetical protein